MAYGFSSINDSNLVQIDQDYSNYVLHSTGTVPVATFDAWGNRFGNYITLPVSTALVFMKCNYTGYASFFSEFDVNNLLRLKIFAAGDYSVYTYYIYVPSSFYAAASYNSGYGLNVYKPDGNLSYSSGLKPLHIVQTVSFVTGTWIAGGGIMDGGEDLIVAPIAITAGRTRAVGLNALSNFGDQVSDTGNYQAFDPWFTDDSNIPGLVQYFGLTVSLTYWQAYQQVDGGSWSYSRDNTWRTLVLIEV